MDYTRPWLCTALLTVGAACGEGGEPWGVIVTDSAGVEIVTNARTFDEVPSRVLAAEPDQEIRDEALYRVAALQPLSDDQIAVAVNGSGSVLIYDAAGELVAELGRNGDGPGEFRYIESLVSLPGDSLGVYDPQLIRLTLFPLHGGGPRVLGLSDVAPARSWSRVHSLRTGLAFIGRAGIPVSREPGIHRETRESYRVDLTGRVLSTYGEFPGMQAFVANGRVGPAPFGALLFTATVEDRLVVGTGEHPELRTYGRDGGLTRIVRWVSQDRTVTQERMDQFVESMVSQGPPEESSAIRDRFARMRPAPELPTHWEVLLSPTGVMWVGEYPGPETMMSPGRRMSARGWVIFDPEGAMKERIETPPGFLPIALTENVVWGVYYDEQDVESVRAYSIGQ